MVRLQIILEEQDKRWLEKHARAKHVSMAQLIRTAIKQYRHAEKKKLSIEELLKKTRGIWPHGDGLVYQNTIRSE